MKSARSRVPQSPKHGLLSLLLALVLLLLPMRSPIPARATPGVDKGDREKGLEREALSAQASAGPAQFGQGPGSLHIEKRLQDSPEIIQLFREVQEGPERFFYLEPSGLKELVKTALNENPGLKEAEAAWQALLNKGRRASALPDPNLTVTAFLENVETRVGPQEAVLTLSQRLPWFGKLSAAGQRTLEEALEKAWEWRSRQRETVFQVKKAFYDIYYLDQALDITDEDIATLKRYETITLTRYATGQGIQQNVVKVHSEMARLRERRIILLRQRNSTRGVLEMITGRSSDEEADRPVPEYNLPVSTVSLDDLYLEVQARREELQARHHAVRARQQEVRMARKQYWPDLTLGFNYIMVGDREDPAGILSPPPDNGQDAIGILASINLPVWYHKLRAGVEEARHRETQARAAYRRQEDRVIYELQDAYIHLESIKEQLNLYEGALIPQARQSRDSSEAAYKTGEITFLELLDSERVLLNVRYGQAKIRAEYLTALARMERVLGSRFPRIPEPEGADHGR